MAGPGKTPIGYLQEVCAKRGITPTYDLVATEGEVHEPTFIFRCTAGDYQGNGRGPNKKKAKHEAAKAVLCQMFGVVGNEKEGNSVQSGHPNNKSMSIPTIPQLNDDGIPGNPVGQLQELTQKKKWAPPIYEFTQEEGPAHSREFICVVRLFGKVKETGVGKSKKSAKRKAAYHMLQKISAGLNLSQEEMEYPEELDDESVPLGIDGKGSYTALKEGRRLTSKAGPQLAMKIRNPTGALINALQTTHLNAPNMNHCQILVELATEQRFEVTYFDLPEVSSNGQCQCLIQMSTIPVMVCHGVGNNQDASHTHAAHNALQCLKVMTKKI